MKKLLVLVLVLGMAAAANAAIEATVYGDFIIGGILGSGDVTLNVTTYTVPDIDGYMAITIKGPGSLTSSLGPAAPTDAAFVGTMAENGLDGLYGNGDIYNMISYTSTYPSGAYINASYTGAEYDGPFNPNNTVLSAYASIDGVTWTCLYQTPEPATIALLCFGGLMLRRRK